jgi:hypothetical protein
MKYYVTFTAIAFDREFTGTKLGGFGTVKRTPPLKAPVWVYELFGLVKFIDVLEFSSSCEALHAAHSVLDGRVIMEKWR